MEGNEFDMEGALGTISEDLFGGEASSEGQVSEGAEALEVDTAVDAAATETSAAEAATSSQEAPATPAPPVSSAPRTWRSEAAAEWANIPAKVQEEILKREEDMFRGLEGYKADANIGKTVSQIITPYLPALQAAGIDPMRQISDIMRTHHALSTGTPELKEQFFLKLAEQYGVNLGGEAPYVDPQVSALQNELHALKSRLMEREGREAETVRTKLLTEIDEFAARPENQYFDEVAGDIAALLRSGAAKDLKEAYDKAVWANPVTRAKEQSRMTTEALSKAEAEKVAHAKAAAKASQANVRSRARPASTAASAGTIDDTLEMAMREIRSRAH